MIHWAPGACPPNPRSAVAGSGSPTEKKGKNRMTPAPLDQLQLRKVIDDFGQNLTLPSAAYTSREVLAWEKENLWQRTWVCVGRLNELVAPSQARAIDLDDESVLLVRDEDGTLRSFSNVSRHRGHELAPVGDAIDVRLILF